MLHILQIATILSLIVGYLSVIYGSLFANHKNNPVTWALWLLLDIPALIGTYRHGDDLTLTLTFVVGTFVTLFFLLLKGGLKWTDTETFTCILVGICFILTKISTPTIILWASGLALSFAGIPWFNYLRKRTTVVDIQTKISAIFFLIAMIISVISTSIKGQSLIIAVSAMVYWVIGVCLSFKKEFKFV